jgi:hypothetical protein
MRSGWSVGRQLINQVADKTWQASSGNGERRRCMAALRLSLSGRKDSVCMCELRLWTLQIKSHLAAARINNVFRVEARGPGGSSSDLAIHTAPIINSTHCNPTARLLSFALGHRRELMLNRTLFIRICRCAHTMAALLSGSRINGAA